jgi:Arc/MetJ-type ribon-helix-helix transcriptional regulator
MVPIIDQSYEEQARMRLLTVHFPEGLLKEIDKLIQKGFYPNRSEAIRSGMYYLLISMGKVITDGHAGNAKIFQLFTEFMKGQMAEELLQSNSIPKTQARMKKNGLEMEKSEITSIDKDLGPKHHHKRNENLETIKEMFAEGKDVSTIANRLNMRYGTVYAILCKEGLYITKKNRVLDLDAQVN